MEVIETIVIQSAEVEGKETVVSTADTDKTKAGEFKRSLPVNSFHLRHCSKHGGPHGGAVSVCSNEKRNTDSYNWS